MRYVIDACIWIKLLRKHRRVRERFSQALPDPKNEFIVTPVADTLTAAFASVLDATIATDNEAHFATFGLPTENWAA